MNRCLATALLVTTLAGSGLAQHALSGTWEGETPRGASIVLTLSVKETVLTGTLVRAGETGTLADGKVSKNTFTFRTTVNDQTDVFSGELAGEEIRLWLERQGPSNAIVLRRAKQKSTR